MNEKVKFKPNFYIANEIKCLFSEEDIKKEKSVYACTEKFIRENCGPVTNKVLDSIPKWYLEKAEKLSLSLNIDVRVHRLEKGDLPTYPGWHCDNAFRELYFDQKEEKRIKVHESMICSVSSCANGVSNTQFLNKPFIADVNSNQEDHEIWQQVHKQIGNPNPCDLSNTKDGQMICFDTQTLHRVMPAKNNGYRLFMRVSMWDNKNIENQGTIAKFEQVYKIVNIKEGYAV